MKLSNLSKTIQVRIEPELKDVLDFLSAHKTITTSEVVRICLIKHLAVLLDEISLETKVPKKKKTKRSKAKKSGGKNLKTKLNKRKGTQ